MPLTDRHWPAAGQNAGGRRRHQTTFEGELSKRNLVAFLLSLASALVVAVE
eukprot:m.281272 g.281272  ORF g.281272 m.281272 type:complete len:51 (-) comp19402_c1_seq10:1326-1478(-)